MRNYQSQKADLTHISALQSWFANEHELLTWGGPGLKFGLSTVEFAQQIKLSELASYVLLEKDEVLAFGQFYLRLGRHHFGRLAVSPKQRGKRLSYHLLSMLAQQATKRQNANGYSLFVLQDNKAAIRTYQNCGFVFKPYPEEIPGALSDCLYMVAERLAFPCT